VGYLRIPSHVATTDAWPSELMGMPASPPHSASRSARRLVPVLLLSRPNGRAVGFPYEFRLKRTE